jgi:hypothetical protein
VSKLYNQPGYQRGGGSIQVMKLGYAVLEEGVARWPYSSWKCVDAQVAIAGPCVWDWLSCNTRD